MKDFHKESFSHEYIRSKFPVHKPKNILRTFRKVTSVNKAGSAKTHGLSCVSFDFRLIFAIHGITTSILIPYTIVQLSCL